MAKILVVDDETDLEVLIKQKFRKKIRNMPVPYTSNSCYPSILFDHFITNPCAGNVIILILNTGIKILYIASFIRSMVVNPYYRYIYLIDKLLLHNSNI